MKKTKFAYASDIHLEFGKPDFTLPDADVLILAGDIVPVIDLESSKTLIGTYALHFFKEVSAKYNKVIWCPGNHEYYGTTFISATKIVNKFFVDNNITNIVFSDKGSVVYNLSLIHI